MVSVLYGNSFIMPDTIPEETILYTYYDTVYVNNNVFVPKGALWGIGPGTVVYCTGPYYVKVEGEVEALGHKGREITFTADSTEGWGGFSFHNNRHEPDNEFKYSDFHYCVFEYAYGLHPGFWSSQGGVMGSFFYDSIAVNYCTFLSNRAVSGGAIYLYYSSLTINNSTFSGNRANKGGALFLRGEVSIINSIFTQNIASVYRSCGGAIAILSGNLHLRDSYFNNNSSDRFNAGGGAIYATEVDSIIIENSFFIRNAAMQAGGGALTLDEVAYLKLANNLFDRNYVYPDLGESIYKEEPNAGGAVYFRSIGYGEVFNNSFVRNVAYLKQPTFFFTKTLDTLLFYNNIVVPVDSAAQWMMLETDSLNHLHFANNLITDSFPSQVKANPNFFEENNIIGDPLFLSHKNYRLQGASPCINAGLPVDSNITKDLLGFQRVVNDTIDIGAYEFQLTNDSLSRLARFDDLTLPEDFDTIIIPLNDYFSYSLGFEWIVFSVQGQGITESSIEYEQHGSYLELTSLPHQHGEDTLVLSASDGYGQVLLDTFVVSVWWVNDPPELKPLDTLFVGEFQSQGNLVHCFDFFDPDTGQVHTWQLVDTLGVFSLDSKGCLRVEDTNKVDRHRYPLFEIKVMVDDGEYTDTLELPVRVHWVNSPPVFTVFPDTLYLPYQVTWQSCDTCFDAFDPDSALGQRLSWSMEIDGEINCRISLFNPFILRFWLYPISKDSAWCSVIHAVITVSDDAVPPASVSRSIVFIVQYPEENSIEQIYLDNDALVLYPNPVSDILHVETDLFIEALWLVNMQGQLLYGRVPERGEATSTIDVSFLPAGPYRLIVRADGQYGTWQWIKE